MSQSSRHKSCSRIVSRTCSRLRRLGCLQACSLLEVEPPTQRKFAPRAPSRTLPRWPRFARCRLPPTPPGIAGRAIGCNRRAMSSEAGTIAASKPAIAHTSPWRMRCTRPRWSWVARPSDLRRPCPRSSVAGRRSPTGCRPHLSRLGGLRRPRVSGTIAASVCNDEEQCGWDAEAMGFRCLSPELDACDGVDRFGRCQGDEARYCVDGVLQRTGCQPCATCRIQAASGRATCDAGQPP
jgi:hypothetical protein